MKPICQNCTVEHSANDTCADATAHELTRLRAALVQISIQACTLPNGAERLALLRMVDRGLGSYVSAAGVVASSSSAIDRAIRIGTLVPLLIGATRLTDSGLVATIASTVCAELARLLGEYRLDLSEVLPQEVCTRCRRSAIDFRRCDAEVICNICATSLDLGELVLPSNHVAETCHAICPSGLAFGGLQCRLDLRHDGPHTTGDPRGGVGSSWIGGVEVPSQSELDADDLDAARYRDGACPCSCAGCGRGTKHCCNGVCNLRRNAVPA